MKNTNKYTRQYYLPPKTEMKWTKKDYIDKAPIWCSVDLRDGNQALITPMSLDEKISFYKLLLEVGFKQIEVGFPAASDTEYTFLRTLVEQNLVPDDVTIQVLTQSREHIIRKTFEALKGVKNAIVHLYNSTSVAQREQVFRKSKKEIIDIAVEGAKLFDDIAKEMGVDYRYEYSPESFTGTEPEFALEICNEVLDVWKPTPEKKVIINLPVTVELSMPHVYANQVEFISDNIKYRDSVEISLHPHNDRGCGVADTELGLLAGADRVEGTLFGNGERTGNVDIITVAMNMYSQGVEPGLDFSNMPMIVSLYEKVTGMQVNMRSPYSGKLVFAAFSGSHQDAIAKGMKWIDEKHPEHWTVPYLPIDPKDVGREYETDVIRINSQSGKGGIGYLVETRYGYKIPKKMSEDVGYTIKGISDRLHKELTADEVFDNFLNLYVNVNAPLELIDYHFQRDPDVNVKDIRVSLTVKENGKEKEIIAFGNGRLDAIANALRANGLKFSDLTYEEHALEQGSKSQAVSYVSIKLEDGSVSWGTGLEDDIIASSIKALFSAVNRFLLSK
ncbi:MAG: 2-isopropylmalate synthase [Clostridiales bacterium]|nr:2-isopropylmalate synthase [Clostridiales bacterium]